MWTELMNLDGRLFSLLHIMGLRKLLRWSQVHPIISHICSKVTSFKLTIWLCNRPLCSTWCRFSSLEDDSRIGDTNPSNLLLKTLRYSSIWTCVANLSFTVKPLYACLSGLRCFWYLSPFASDTLQVLLSKGAEVSLADMEGCTPLHYACERGHVEVVNRLVRSGALVEAVDIEGRTPVYVGAWICLSTSDRPLLW